MKSCTVVSVSLDGLIWLLVVEFRIVFEFLVVLIGRWLVNVCVCAVWYLEVDDVQISIYLGKFDFRKLKWIANVHKEVLLPFILFFFYFFICVSGIPIFQNRVVTQSNRIKLKILTDWLKTKFTRKAWELNRICNIATFILLAEILCYLSLDHASYVRSWNISVRNRKNRSIWSINPY